MLCQSQCLFQLQSPFLYNANNYANAYANSIAYANANACGNSNAYAYANADAYAYANPYTYSYANVYAYTPILMHVISAHVAASFYAPGIQFIA